MRLKLGLRKQQIPGNVWHLRCAVNEGLKVCWKDMITNNSIRDKVQRNVTVVDIIKQRKLQLYGHICRMPDKRLIKTIMLGMVDRD